MGAAAVAMTTAAARDLVQAEALVQSEAIARGYLRARLRPLVCDVLAELARRHPSIPAAWEVLGPDVTARAAAELLAMRGRLAAQREAPYRASRRAA